MKIPDKCPPARTAGCVCARERDGFCAGHLLRSTLYGLPMCALNPSHGLRRTSWEEPKCVGGRLVLPSESHTAHWSAPPVRPDTAAR